jgi:hypothetical protein
MHGHLTTKIYWLPIPLLQQKSPPRTAAPGLPAEGSGHGGSSHRKLAAALTSPVPRYSAACG